MALNLYDFVVRRPYKPAEKYGLRAYDEIILAPMVRHIPMICTASITVLMQCIFEPRVVEFDVKRIDMRPNSHPDVTEEILEHASDQVVSLNVVGISQMPSKSRRSHKQC